MRHGARMRAAVEVLEEVIKRHRPATSALADWGRAHRFAGSGDRAAIGNLVFDVLRKKLSLAARMQDDSCRALVIAAAAGSLSLKPDEVSAAADGSEHALSPLSEAEHAGLGAILPEDAASYIAGDYPAWLCASLTRVFKDRAGAEGAALSERAPVDVRVNGLKAAREKVMKHLARHGARATPLSPIGVRIAASAGAQRAPNVEADTAHGRGWFEVQDAGSQVAALMAGVGPRQQVLDLCAGAGGKTLAFAASMHNTGQIYAYDASKTQLRPIFERLRRAGARNVQVMEAGDRDALAALGPRFDVVFVDAPCTGSGTWRRRPDAKWRLKPQQLGDRQSEQRQVLELARQMVKPGGHIVYVTCSVLPEENTDQVAWFQCEAPEMALVPWRKTWSGANFECGPPHSADGRDDCLLLTPHMHGTDGFYIATFKNCR